MWSLLTTFKFRLNSKNHMQLKPGSTYRMSRANKVLLASYIDRHQRGEIKRTVIQADLYGRQHMPKNRDKNQPTNG